MRELRYGLRALGALALLALLAAPGLGQKSTISSRGGRSGGGGGGFVTGRLSPVGSPRVPSAIGAPAGGLRSAPTLSPSFPTARGRVDGPWASGGWQGATASGGWMGAVPSAPRPTLSSAGGALSPAFPLRGRSGSASALAPGLRPSGFGKASLAPGVAGAGTGRSSVASAGTAGKRFLPAGTLPVRGTRAVDDWHKRVVIRDGRTFLFFDPFFVGRPFFFTDGLFLSDGLFFVHDPFFFGHRFVFGDPFFFSHRFAFGRPILFGPPPLSLFLGWPGFWTQSLYYGSGYAPGADYANGYQQGFNQGFASGQSYGPGYGPGGAAPEAEPYAGSDLDVAPRAELPSAPRFDEGRQRMFSGQYSAALAAFDAYVREQPSDPRGKLARGAALLALGRYGEAADAFRRAIDDIAPESPVEFDMPALFGSRSAFRTVQGSLEDYVRSHADDDAGRFDLGVLYFFGGDFDAARTLLSGLGDDPYADRLMRQILAS